MWRSICSSLSFICFACSVTGSDTINRLRRATSDARDSTRSSVEAGTFSFSKTPHLTAACNRRLSMSRTPTRMNVETRSRSKRARRRPCTTRRRPDAGVNGSTHNGLDNAKRSSELRKEPRDGQLLRDWLSWTQPSTFCPSLSRTEANLWHGHGHAVSRRPSRGRPTRRCLLAVRVPRALPHGVTRTPRRGRPSWGCPTTPTAPSRAAGARRRACSRRPRHSVDLVCGVVKCSSMAPAVPTEPPPRSLLAMLLAPTKLVGRSASMRACGAAHVHRHAELAYHVPLAAAPRARQPATGVEEEAAVRAVDDPWADSRQRATERRRLAAAAAARGKPTVAALRRGPHGAERARRLVEEVPPHPRASCAHSGGSASPRGGGAPSSAACPDHRRRRRRRGCRRTSTRRQTCNGR